MKHHFLPHKTLGHRAKLLSHHSFLIYIFFIVLNFGLLKFVSINYPEILGFATNINVNDLLEDTNREREQLGLSPLTLNNSLSSAAAGKAQNMFSNNYWAHIAPDGTTPWYFILNAGYDYSFAGENLAKDFNSSKAVVEAWMNSPTHRANVVNSKYKDIGFAVLNGELDGKETTLVVQMFGATKQPVFLAENRGSISNEAPATALVESPTILNVEVEQAKIPQPVIKPEVFGVVVSPKFDLKVLNKYFSIFMASFVLMLFVLDIYYTKKHNIVRLSGNTIAHIFMVLMAIAGIWYSTLGAVL